MANHLQRHRPDVIALVFGVMFLIEGLAALAQQRHWVHLHGRTWFGVVVVTVALLGAAAVTAAALRDGSAAGSSRAAPPVDSN
jgi:hypothetical protein